MKFDIAKLEELANSAVISSVLERQKDKAFLNNSYHTVMDICWDTEEIICDDLIALLNRYHLSADGIEFVGKNLPANSWGILDTLDEKRGSVQRVGIVHHQTGLISVANVNAHAKGVSSPFYLNERDKNYLLLYDAVFKYSSFVEKYIVGTQVTSDNALRVAKVYLAAFGEFIVRDLSQWWAINHVLYSSCQTVTPEQIPGLIQSILEK